MINSYLRREALNTEDPVQQYLSLHASGQLDAALQLAESFEQSFLSSLPSEIGQFLAADMNLIRSKLGRKPDLSRKSLASPLADLVLQYAFFTHYFWVDHREAVQSLGRMLRLSLRTLRADFVLMTLFLMAHLRTIANRRVFSYKTALAIYRVSAFLRRRGMMSPFAHDIIVATFPYTNYVRAEFKGMEKALVQSKPLLGADPYYNLLFSITYLYHAAYSGNIVDTERTVAVFKRLQDQGKLLRYRPVTILMGILPFCIRGYEHVVRDQFVSFIGSYDQGSHDTLINSQVFRIAAIVYTSLGEYQRADSAIDLAVQYRKKAAFHSWTHVDEKIKRVINEKRDIEDIFGAIGTSAVDRSAYLKSGFVISKLVDQLAQITGDMEQLASGAAQVIARHLDVDYTLAGGSAGNGHPRLQLPVALFGRQVVFLTADQHKYDQARQLLEILLPPVRSIEATALRLKSAQDRLKEQEKLAAIAGTAQMLAHDVRKPFSMIEGLMKKMQSADAPTAKALSEQYLPDVRRSLKTVNSMIDDIMEVGRSSDIAAGARENRSQEEAPSASLAEVLEEVLAGVIGPDVRGIDVESDVGHSGMLAVDAVKLSRVLTNILDNAVQAIGAAGGKIWIRTRDISHPSGDWIGVTVGNSNSYIPADDVPKLFDAFYTKNKEGGTGLGLAIVKKIVGAYGGEIACESSLEEGTQFHFTLPAWVGAGSSHIVVVDDCPFIRGQWAELSALKAVKVFASPEEFWQACRTDESILREAMSVVTDFYFDDESGPTGVDFAGSMRAAGYAGPLYISSNAPLDEIDVSTVNALMIAKDPALAMAAISGRIHTELVN